MMVSWKAEDRLFAGETKVGQHVIGWPRGLFQTGFVVPFKTLGGLFLTQYKAELLNNLFAVKTFDVFF